MAEIDKNDADVSPKRLNEAKVEKSHVETLRAEESHYEIDPIIEARITRKFDLRIIPWLFGIW